MSKLIRLKLSKIKYTGDSIGDDIRLEIECLNFFIGLNKQIKNNTAVDPDNPWEIGVFDLEIPYTSHRGGTNYPNVKYAKV